MKWVKTFWTYSTVIDLLSIKTCCRIERKKFSFLMFGNRGVEITTGPRRTIGGPPGTTLPRAHFFIIKINFAKPCNPAKLAFSGGLSG